MNRYTDYTQGRVRHLVREIGGKIYDATVPMISIQVADAPDRISFAEAQKLTQFRPAKLGDQFGPQWATFWFKLEAAVPADWKGHRVDLIWDTHSEATLWLNGKSVQGLNMTHGDRPDAVLLKKASGGESLSMQVEMACNRKFGNAVFRGPPPGEPLVSPYSLQRCHIARFNPAAWDIYYDSLTLIGLFDELAKDGDITERNWAGHLINELNHFCNVFDLEDASSWSKASAILKPLFKFKNGDRQLEISSIGHAHIDTAWLWPLAETHRKCERSFSTATTYMLDYPEYKFSCSQAYQYDVIRKRNPELYQRIKDRVKAGQWVIVGGTWIEPDCNIPSGEALARQFLVGQQYFKREFSVQCKEFWNPDVFGYNGQLPQIMQLSGVSRFLTQKLSWNRFNRPNHGTFMWEGIDGSEVLAHFPPSDTYNTMMSGAEKDVEWLRANAKLFKDHDRSMNGMMLYGYGDGGGGPTKDMLETLRRVEDLQGLPRFKQRTSDEFFELLEKDDVDRPVQIGELYFEYHRGTYTSQALVKKNNRKSENLMHDLEFLAAVSDKPYPREGLLALWEVVLLNQFHDILPGSSITEVYDDSAKQFTEVFRDGERLIDVVAGKGTSLINTIGVARAEVVEQGGKLSLLNAKPFAAAITTTPTGARASVAKKGDGFVLSNALLTATFDAKGRLINLVHAGTGRETLAKPGNLFETYDDRPNDFDAWDVDPFHLETKKVSAGAHSASIATDDALRAELKFEHKIGKHSKLTQVVRLDVDSPRLEFICDMDWQESQQFLKVAFPVNVRAMSATYEMQFGNTERPTHFNTAYDLARFEVPLHRWFDMTEHGFGVSILSESKYGGSTFGNTMRLSLLRSPQSPDPKADRGQHHFAYAIVPHAGDWRDAGIVAEAMRFNMPLRSIAEAPTESLVTCDDPNLIIDTVKKAEESDALVIRLYECHGSRGRATLHFGKAFKLATPVNILESQIGEPSKLEGGKSVKVDYSPYKIITLRLE